MGIPFRFSQGDKVTWDLPSSVNYKNESVTSANYTCKYYLRSLNGGFFTVTGTSEGNGWKFEISVTDSAALEDGKWNFQAIAVKNDNSDKVTPERGILTIDQTLEYTGSTPGRLDFRTEAEKMVELIETAIKAIITNKAEEYTIGDRTFKYMEISELRRLRTIYKSQVSRYQRADKIRQGKGDPFINKLIFR